VIPIEQLIPHRAPFRFVDEVLEVSPQAGKFLLDLPAGDRRLTNDVLMPLYLLEAMAQGAAAFHGAQAVGKPESGMLVQIEKAKLHRMARAGEKVHVLVEYTRSLGPLVRFSATATVGQHMLAEAALTVARG